MQKRWCENPQMLWKQVITWEMAIKLTWLTWFKASASNFWFIPHKFATFFWHLWCTFIPHSERNVRIVIQASGKRWHYNKQGCSVQFRNPFLRPDWTWTCHCYQNCSFYPLTQWRLKKGFTREKPPIIITLFSKSVTMRIILPFCGGIIKAIFTVNALSALWDATLSQSPNFSYSQGSNFDNAQDYTSAVFPDSFSSSPWLSCAMGPVPLSLFCTKAFLPHMAETNPTLRDTRKGRVCTTSSGGTLGKHRAASSLLLLTFTLEPLPDQPPEQAATVVTEGGAHVVVDSEAVRHVDVEALLLELSTATAMSPQPAPSHSPCPHTAPTLTELSDAFLTWKLCPLPVTELCTALSKDRTSGCTAKHLPSGAVSFCARFC